MQIPIMTLNVTNEMDVMLAHRRAMQFAHLSGIGKPEQTRFATAVSEVARNCIQYAFEGSVKFSVKREKDTSFLLAVIQDKGSGIGNLNQILERNTQNFKGRGLGIIYAKKLADHFSIESDENGTTIELQKAIPKNAALPGHGIIKDWAKKLQKDSSLSAYEELKARNIELIELTEELKKHSAIAERQMEEIKLLNTILLRNNERMKAFTFAISHDLKTPLTNLKISADHIINHPSDEDDDVFKSILIRSVGRLDKTIHSLIEILDIQNEQSPVIAEFDLHPLLAEAMDEFDRDISENRIEVTFNFSAASHIRYIQGFLQSLFRNLLSNAIKYRDPARNLQVHVHSRQMEDGMELTFTDNAAGMEENFIKHRLFTPFARSSTSIEGKGIGLYLIKSMIESNGGSVSVESTLGKGTSFTFRILPYRLL